MIQDEVEQDQSTSIQPIPNQTLEEFLKERMEESNQIFENLVTTSKIIDDPHDKEEESFLQEDYVISEYINEEIPQTELVKSDVATEDSEEYINIKKEESYSQKREIKLKSNIQMVGILEKFILFHQRKNISGSISKDLMNYTKYKNPKNSK